MTNRVDRTTLCRIVSRQSVDLTQNSEDEWGELIRLASQEGMGPLLYWCLAQTGAYESLTKRIRHFLRAPYVRTWVCNLEALKQLRMFCAEFNKASIPIVALKGISHILTIYPDVGIRPMGDIDVLVPENRLADAVEIALQHEYVKAIPEAFPGLSDLMNHEIGLVRKSNPPIALELHKSLIADRSFQFAVPVDWFWEQTEPLPKIPTNDYSELLTLSPSAQVLFCAAHIMLQHGGHKSPLIWLYDLHMLIQHYDLRITWDVLIEQALIFNWGSALRAALTQSKFLFGTPIPDQVMNRLSSIADKNTEIVEENQSEPATHTLAEMRHLQTMAFPVRIKAFWALLAPAPAYMCWRYDIHSKWKIPIYYFVRWWGIILDGVRTFTILIRSIGFL